MSLLLPTIQRDASICPVTLSQPDPLHLQYPITGPQFDRERKEAHWLKLSGFPCTCIYTRSRVAQSR